MSDKTSTQIIQNRQIRESYPKLRELSRKVLLFQSNLLRIPGHVGIDKQNHTRQTKPYQTNKTIPDKQLKLIATTFSNSFYVGERQHKQAVIKKSAIHTYK